jgi:hypothetical protein
MRRCKAFRKGSERKHGQWVWTYMGEDCLRPASRNYGLVSDNPHAEIPEADPRGRGDGRIHGRVLLVLLRVIRFTVLAHRLRIDTSCMKALLVSSPVWAGQ